MSRLACWQMFLAKRKSFCIRSSVCLLWLASVPQQQRQAIPICEHALLSLKIKEEPDLEPYILVETRKKLLEMLDDLSRQSRLGVDFEFCNDPSGHSICLIQVATLDSIFIVDPLAVDTEGPLHEMFADYRVEKTISDSSQDLRVWYSTYGDQLHGIFDVAQADCLLRNRNGLKALDELLYEHLNVTVKKSKRLQRWGWHKRPLKLRKVEYAATDVAHLLPLREILHEELEKSSLLPFLEFHQDCLEKLVYSPPTMRRQRRAATNSFRFGRKERIEHARALVHEQAADLGVPDRFVLPRYLMVLVATYGSEYEEVLDDLAHLPPSNAELLRSGILELLH